MIPLGVHIFNATREEWLQEDASWGSFNTARSFETDDEAEAVREGITNDGSEDVTYTMVSMT